MMTRPADTVPRERWQSPALLRRILGLAAILLALSIVLGAIGFLGPPVPDAVRHVSGGHRPVVGADPTSPNPVRPAQFTVDAVPADGRASGYRPPSPCD